MWRSVLGSNIRIVPFYHFYLLHTCSAASFSPWGRRRGGSQWTSRTNIPCGGCCMLLLIIHYVHPTHTLFKELRAVPNITYLYPRNREITTCLRSSSTFWVTAGIWKSQDQIRGWLGGGARQGWDSSRGLSLFASECTNWDLALIWPLFRKDKVHKG